MWRDISNTVGVGVFSTVVDIMSTMGVILSTVGILSTMGDTMSTMGGGGVQYYGRKNLLLFEYHHGTHDILPHVS